MERTLTNIFKQIGNLFKKETPKPIIVKKPEPIEISLPMLHDISKKYGFTREELLKKSTEQPKKSKIEIIDGYFNHSNSYYCYFRATKSDYTPIFKTWNGSRKDYSPIGKYIYSDYYRSEYWEQLMPVSKLKWIMNHFNATHIDNLLCEEAKGHTLEFWLDLEELHANNKCWIRHYDTSNGTTIRYVLSETGKEYLKMLKNEWRNN